MLSSSGLLYALDVELGLDARFDRAELPILPPWFFWHGVVRSEVPLRFPSKCVNVFFGGAGAVTGPVTSFISMKGLPARYSFLGISESISTSLPPIESMVPASSWDPCITRPISFPDMSCR